MDSAERMHGLHAALTQLENGQHGQAEDICQRLVTVDRNDIDAQLLLGLAIGLRGAADAAASVLHRVALQSPHRTDLLSFLFLDRTK